MAKKSYEVDSNTKTTLTKAAYVTVRPYKFKKKQKSYGTWSTKVVLSKWVVVKSEQTDQKMKLNKQGSVRIN
ncbi:MAG: hypothetical protein ACLT2Z_01340 [Eubacterium sp.]